MMQNKIKILVACHKPDTVYHDDVYIPIHVGRAVSKCKKEMEDFIGDDTGENISAKNPYYCELTAQYWAWKNLDVEYIGLCHYRRYFETKLTVDNIDSILGDKYDVMCISKSYDYNCMGARLVKATCLEDFQIFMYALKTTSPEYFESAKRFLSKGQFSPYNMFVMKRDKFQRFAEWQFRILFEMEKHVRLSGYTRGRRLYGYYAEMLLPIYIEYNHYRIKESKCVSMIGEKSSNGIGSFLWGKWIGLYHKIFTARLDIDVQAVIVGFKQDGINIGYVDK